MLVQEKQERIHRWFAVFNSWSRRNGLSKYNFASFIFSFIRVGYFFSRGKYHANQSLFHLFEHDLRIERFHDLKNARKKRIQCKIYEKRRYHVFDIRNIKRRIVSRCKQNRSFQSHLFFFLNGKRAGFPLVFREYGTGRCCSVQNIQIDSYIHTRGRTSMDFAFAAIVNDFEALAASWFWSITPLPHPLLLALRFSLF